MKILNGCCLQRFGRVKGSLLEKGEDLGIGLFGKTSEKKVVRSRKDGERGIWKGAGDETGMASLNHVPAPCQYQDRAGDPLQGIRLDAGFPDHEP